MFIKTILFFISMFFITTIGINADTKYYSSDINIKNLEYQNLNFENFTFKFQNILFLLEKVQAEYHNSNLYSEFFFDIVISPEDYLDYLEKYEIMREDIIDNEFLITLINTLEYINLKELKTSKIVDVLYISQSIHLLKNDLINQDIKIMSKEGQELISLERTYLFQSFDINKIK